MRVKTLLISTALLGAVPAMAATPATVKVSAERQKATHDMFEHVVNIPTVFGRGKVPEMANYLADQYKAAGFPAEDVEVVSYDSTDPIAKVTEKTAALIVRWRAPGKAKAKPIMLMGHMDVVEAKREDSTTDPFVLTQKDGYYYGRGTIDMKDGIVAITQALIDLKASGFKPTRDIVVFFTGDEETNGIGADKGASEWKDKLNVEYGLNADGGGGGFFPDGRSAGFLMQTAEKTFAGYTLTVRNRGGHSSKPRKDNAIYTLAHAVEKIEAHRFEPMLSETTRAYFTERQKQEKGALGDAMRAWLANPNDGAAADIIEADEAEVGLTRTRCVPTRLFAGHADNALPQLATAMINCRIFPGVDPNDVQKNLAAIVADPEVIVSRNDDYVASLSSPLRPDVVNAFTKAIRTLHPGAPISPEMSTGASDARPFRIAGIPIYGVNGGWVVVPVDFRAHGKDERLPVQALHDNVVHWKLMLTELAGK
ncbi:acetylornithine deacetylase/succinyl-diaminopimelate desuccinylase-like protein [Sphingorhabdus rigui]|uniref:Acetylornithine deacetylase/succinyl-diaminopimelate desuccinylase-like protein n=1 Tax=Sphingorhabdus rigui TaxID=1282858 RepID=A0A840B124_9SPHN|nr:M20/M25/M40 family metallo-hydrolase [Sphingorhabdus rigui]MBB3944058.1 acetylornithine deacetylase/succinyl-diaminopimelate desuccinylase-like protein [Sphingorhabdus rigui]